MKEKQISEVMASIDNRIRCVWNQGYQQGYEDGKKENVNMVRVIEDRDKHYQRGYEEAKTEFFNNRYQEGLDDAWECARTIINKYGNDFGETRKEIIGYAGYKDAIEHLTASEAIAKIKAWEEKQTEIQVGDVVTVSYKDFLDEDFKAVVTDIDQDKGLWIIDESGSNSVIEPDEYIGEDADRTITKTGKHIDIQSVLEQIRGEEE